MGIELIFAGIHFNTYVALLVLCFLHLNNFGFYLLGVYSALVISYLISIHKRIRDINSNRMEFYLSCFFMVLKETLHIILDIRCFTKNYNLNYVK